MGAAECKFNFDLELKKRSSVATILDQNSYTFNWIPTVSAKAEGKEAATWAAKCAEKK